MTTTVPPTLWTAIATRSGAAWYSGAGLKKTMSSPKP